MEISLTDFTDFVVKSGSPKLTKVQEIRNREEYEPAKDYWKKVRDWMVKMHKENLSKSSLDHVLLEINPGRGKHENYVDIIESYKRFIGRKKTTWFDPPFKVWTNNQLAVKINPELGLNINGGKHIIKLYFKADVISKNKVDLILTLMRESLLDSVPEDCKLGLLDIRRKKLFTHDKIRGNLVPLIMGEALNFETIWINI